MVIEIPDDLEAALKFKASAERVSADMYVRSILERDLAALLDTQAPLRPLKTGRGSLAKYGPAPSAEEIDENRKDMFRNFGENF